VRDRVGDAAVAHVPFLATDVHDFDGLREVARLLWASTR